MKPLLITLFLIANVIFITQSARHVHQLMFGAQPSMLDEFNSETQRARAETRTDALLSDYRMVEEEIRKLEKGKRHQEVQDIQQQHVELYGKRNALRTEISEREAKTRELRDVWLFSVVGIVLIVAGDGLFRRCVVWPGLALLVSGFSILEYWCSPTFFGGAVAEFRMLTLSKVALTLLGLFLLYWFCHRKERRNKAPEPTPTSVMPRANESRTE